QTGSCAFTKEMSAEISDLVYVPESDTVYPIPLIITSHNTDFVMVINALYGYIKYVLNVHKSHYAKLIYVPPHENKYQVPLLISCNQKDAILWDLNTGLALYTYQFDKVDYKRNMVWLHYAENPLKLPILLVTHGSSLHINY